MVEDSNLVNKRVRHWERMINRTRGGQLSNRELRDLNELYLQSPQYKQFQVSCTACSTRPEVQSKCNHTSRVCLVPRVLRVRGCSGGAEREAQQDGPVLVAVSAEGDELVQVRVRVQVLIPPALHRDRVGATPHHDTHTGTALSDRVKVHLTFSLCLGRLQQSCLQKRAQARRKRRPKQKRQANGTTKVSRRF